MILLSVASAVFELVQTWIPSRGRDVDNWAASTAGTVTGMVVGLAILRLLGVKLGFDE
jgi:VanZ family protein